TNSDGWTHVFHVTLTCPYTAASAPNFPTFDTDAAEFDRIQRGTPFAVRYLPDVPLPLLIVGVTSAHLARDTVDVHVEKLIVTLTPVVLFVGYLGTLSFLGYLMSKHKIPGIRWAFFGLLLPGVLWMLTPTLPVTLTGPTTSGTATVKEFHVFNHMLQSSRSSG